MEYADNSWLFFAVSVPLTLFTIIVWYTWANSRRFYNAAMAKQKQKREELQGRVAAFKVWRRTATSPC